MLGDELISGVRSLLDEPSDALLSDEEILSFANRVLPSVAVIAVEAGNPFYLEDTTVSANSEGDYELPSSVWILEAVIYPFYGRQVALSPHYTTNYGYNSAFYNLSSLTRPPVYKVYANKIVLIPKPSSPPDVTLLYHRRPSTITSSGDIDVPVELEQVLLLQTTIYSAIKAGYSTAELEQKRLLEERRARSALSLSAVPYPVIKYRL